MIIPVVLNGWGASSRKEKTRTHALVEQLLINAEVDHLPVLGLRASLLRGRSRRVKKYILQHEYDDHVLLLVGKSLGARNIVKRVLNRLSRPLKYAGVYLVTIDPCWPESWDLTPNLNGRTLKLKRRVDGAINVYVVAKRKRQQAGALLCGTNGSSVANVPVVDADHYTIVQHVATRSAINEAISRARLRPRE